MNLFSRYFYNLLLMNLSARRVRYRLVICLVFRHISSHTLRLIFKDRCVTGLVLPPHSKLLVKFVGRILTRGVLNLYLFLPTSRVFSLLCRTRHSFWKIHCTWLSYPGVESGVKVVILWACISCLIMLGAISLASITVPIANGLLPLLILSLGT